jgi:hypothetical protein
MIEICLSLSATLILIGFTSQKNGIASCTELTITISQMSKLLIISAYLSLPKVQSKKTLLLLMMKIYLIVRFHAL